MSRLAIVCALLALAENVWAQEAESPPEAAPKKDEPVEAPEDDALEAPHAEAPLDEEPLDEEPLDEEPLDEEVEAPLDEELLDEEALDVLLMDVPDVEAEPLHLYGFADFGARKLFYANDSSWLLNLPNKTSFLVGNLNLYLRANPAPRWTSLSEVRFTFLPHGGKSAALTSSQERDNQELRDYADPANLVRVGGTTIERAWIEYNWNQYLKIRMGRWFTPYGIWNIDHGSPTLLGWRLPFVVSSQYMPKSQTGLQILGEFRHQDYKLRYTATLSNGRGPYEEYLDLDENKAGGLSFKLETPWLDEATFGVAGFYGKETDSHEEIAVGSDNGVPTYDFRTVIDSEARGLSLSADARLRYKGLLVQSEFVLQRRIFSNRGRPEHFAVPGALMPDHVNFGAYLILGYELPWQSSTIWTSTEYAAAQEFNIKANLNTVGITLRPVPTISLKLSFSILDISKLKNSEAFAPTDPLSTVESQVAWVF